MLDTSPTRCLLLACGNPLRGDDGVGPWLAAWAFERFAGEPGVRVIARQQWGPELAEDIAHSECVLFVDSSLQATPGQVSVVAAKPMPGEAAGTTHHLDAAALLALCRRLYGSLPARAFLLTVGIESVELDESLSEAVQRAVPEACHNIEEIVRGPRP